MGFVLESCGVVEDEWGNLGMYDKGIIEGDSYNGLVREDVFIEEVCYD